MGAAYDILPHTAIWHPNVLSYVAIKLDYVLTMGESGFIERSVRAVPDTAAANMEKSMGSRAESSGLKLTAQDAALIRGMIERGDRHHDIAAFFGVNQGRIAEIKDGKRFTEIPSADRQDLPPKGPYLTPKRAWMENRLR